jgi:signal transduction histidine kinase
VPGFIDGLAMLGLLGRSARFAPSTQRAGLALMTGMGSLSLACNVYAGHNLGQRLYGVLVVTVFVVAEWYAMKLRPAPAPVVTVSERRSEAAKRGALKAQQTKAQKAAEALKAQAECDAKSAAARERRRLARQVAELEHSFTAADAPVSPAA